MSISFTPTCKPLGTIACNNAFRLVRKIRTHKPHERFQRQSSLLQVAHTDQYPGCVRTKHEVKMRTTALRPLRTGRKTQKIGPKWTENWPKFALLDTRDRFRKRVGIIPTGFHVAWNSLISGHIFILIPWMQQRKASPWMADYVARRRNPAGGSFVHKKANQYVIIKVSVNSNVGLR